MAKNDATKANDLVWINYDLTKQDKEKLKKYFAEDDSEFQALEAAINTGHKLTVGYDGFAKAFAAYLFPGPNNSINKGMALSARGSTASSALRGLLYRHFVIFEGSWRVLQSGPKLDDVE